MSYGLLKRAGAFLLASALVFGAVFPSLAESLGPDTGGTERTTEADPADADTSTGASDEDTQPADSYIICLPEGNGAEYSYDEGHMSEENSDEAFTILLYGEGEEVLIGVTAELGFALYGTDGSLFLRPEGGELDFVMPAQDLQLVFDEPQAETQAQPETPAEPDADKNTDYWNGGTEGTQLPVGVQVPEAIQDPAGGEAPEPEGPGAEIPEADIPELSPSLKWEASNVSIEARTTDGSSFPEGATLCVDTPDTLMENSEGAMAYGKAVADALGSLDLDDKPWALFPFETALGEGADFPEGLTEYSVVFSDSEIVQAFQAGTILPAVITYAIDHESLTVADAEMVDAQDMDSFLSEDGTLAVNFLSETGTFTVAFLTRGDPAPFADDGGWQDADQDISSTQTEIEGSKPADTAGGDAEEADPSNAGKPDNTVLTAGLSDGTTVTVAVSEDTILPEGAKLHANALDEANANAAAEAARQALGLSGDEALRFLPLDIYLTGADGARFEPAGGVSVRIEYPEDPFADGGAGDVLPDAVQGGADAAGILSGLPSGDGELFALHMKTDGGVEKLGMSREVTDTGVAFTFDVDSFSLMGPAALSALNTADTAAPAEFSCTLEDGTVVTAVLGGGVELPDGAEFHAAFIRNDDLRMEGIQAAFREAVGLTTEETPDFFPCEVYFADAAGDRIETGGSVRLTVEFGSLFGDARRERQAVRLNSDGTAEVLDSGWSEDGSAVTFEADTLSLFGFAATPGKEVTVSYTAELDDGTAITVTAGEDAGIPDGAQLHAERIAEEDGRMAELRKSVWFALGLSGDNQPLLYPCDIWFTDADGRKIEPEGTVRVAVQFGGSLFADAKENSQRRVVHVRDDGSTETFKDAEWSGDGVTFAAGSFSVFCFLEMPDTGKEHDFTYRLGEGVTIAIDMQEGSTLPEGAVLEMRPVGQDSPEYAKTVDAAMGGLETAGGGVTNTALYGICFIAGGEEVWPTGGVRVTVLFDSLPANVGNREVVQVKDNGSAEPLDADWTVSSSAAVSAGEGSADEVFSDEGLADGGHVNSGAVGNASVAFDVDSISLFGLMEMPGGIRIISAETGPITWGDVVVDGVVQSDDGNGVRTWDVSGSAKRYLDVPVKILVSSDKDMTITLNRYIDGNIRGEFAGIEKAEVTTDAAVLYCDSITPGEDTTTLKVRAIPGAHVTFQVLYKFDCWGVESGKEFTVNYTRQVAGEEEEQGTLTGKIVTGHGVQIVNEYNPSDPLMTYFDSRGRGNGYSLNEFGGVDYVTSYILNWSPVYETYFGVPDSEFDLNTYIYDIAPFLVKPTGQQPYDISGTVTPEHGEVLGGVYMMNSAAGSGAPWKKLDIQKQSNGGCTFEFKHNEKFNGPAKDTAHSLIDKVVTGNLTDQIDNQHYTLYFLVRYKKDGLPSDSVQDTTHWTQSQAYTLKATLELTHTGADDSSEQKDSLEQVLYKGPITDSQIYDAYYNYFLTNQQDALSNLDKGKPATLDFEADFFCYNEARSNFNKEDPDKYRLEAVIDLLYLTGKKPYDTLSEQLTSEDYKFNHFSLSLVDAPGSWSQNWYYEDKGDNDEVWKEQRPNTGWPESTWGGPKEGGYGNVSVYGSTSHDGSWELIEQFDVGRIWAKDQGRGINDGRYGGSNKHTFSASDKYVRLKVVYDSRWTTALRVGYEVALLPAVLDRHSGFELKTTSSQELTVWFNYFGYRKIGPGDSDDNWSADTDNMNYQRYPHFDGDWSYNDYAGDRGTIEIARQYDKAQANGMGFASKFNTGDGEVEKTYSLRDYVRIILGRMKDQAGMLVTQALFDSSGAIVGSDSIYPLNGSVENGSFCKEKTVTEVSEIVYTISGGITNGAMNWQSLQEHRKEANSESPFGSLHMRYYVLLPEGFRLKTTAYTPHHNSADEFLSPNPAFYDTAHRTTGVGNTVLTSNSNIPAWKELSGNGCLSEMYWNDAGAATLNTELTKGRLVVFDRTLTEENVSLGEVFNLHGATETYFWGRGLSFSIEPERGTGSIWPKDYTTQFWCQYLDGDGNPLSLGGFEKGVEDVKADNLNTALGDKKVNEDTLLYIPSKFRNKSVAGTTKAQIVLESEYTDKDGNPNVQFDMDYKYKLEYAVSERPSHDVILWANIEDQYNSTPQYRGTVTGVDLSELPEDVRSKVRVYVKEDYFDADTYAEENAGKDRFDMDGWKEVTEEQRDGYDWSKVKAVAFYFEGVDFKESEDSSIISATVKVNMRGPKREGVYHELDGKIEKTFDAVSPMLFSDSLEGETKDVCTRANQVPVSITVRDINLPATGSFGTAGFVMAGLVLCAGGTAVLLWTRRRRIRPGRERT